MMEPIFSYDDVTITYGNTVIVEDISFSVSEGETLCIVGESGSGKSTILKGAMGLLDERGRIAAGTIQLLGRDITEMTPTEREEICGSHMAMVFQQAGQAFCPVRTIGSQLYEMVQAHQRMSREQAKEAALSLFSRLGFAEGERIWNSYPFELSGGMNQRVGIAAAVLLKPEVLLADEPTSALDVCLQRDILSMLQDIQRLYHMAMVLVTHDMGVAAAMADKVLVLAKGRAVEFGMAEQVFSHPRHEYTRLLVQAIPRLRR